MGLVVNLDQINKAATTREKSRVFVATPPGFSFPENGLFPETQLIAADGGAMLPPSSQGKVVSYLAISRFDCPQLYMRELGMKWCRVTQ